MRKVDNSRKRHEWFAWYPVKAWSEEHGCKMDVWLEKVVRYKIGYSWCWSWMYEVKENE